MVSFESVFETIRSVFSPSPVSAPSSSNSRSLVEEILLQFGTAVSCPVMVYVRATDQSLQRVTPACIDQLTRGWLFLVSQRIRTDYAAASSTGSGADASRAICRSVIRQLIQHTEVLFPLKLSPSLRSQCICRIAGLYSAALPRADFCVGVL